MPPRSRSPARRGGRHQRAVARDPLPACAADPAPGGHVKHKFDAEQAFNCVYKWAWGLDPATEVQRECATAHRDQIQLLTRLGVDTAHASRSLSALAALGSHGRYPSHIKKELVNLIGWPDIVETHHESVPMAITKPVPGGPTFETAPFPILVPP